MSLMHRQFSISGREFTLASLVRDGYKVFLGIVSPRKKLNYRALYSLFLIAILAIFLVFLVNLLSIGRSGFGEWGDFFGGVLNPILTFLTFMGLLITIVIQQKELRESRRELKRSADALMEQVANSRQQNFETTFFQMLATHNKIVDSIDLVSEDGKVTRGRDCFVVFYRRLRKSFNGRKDKQYVSNKEKVALQFAYKEFWNDHQLELGHYFRFLYNVLRFIKESGFSDGPYIRLIRAQLSDQELLLIFYNCIVSGDGAKFKPLAEEFALLNNMPKIRVLSKGHLKMIGGAAFGSGA